MMGFEKEDNWNDVLSYRRPNLVWIRHREDGNIYYSSAVDGDTWIVRLNDFPDEPLHTLIVGGEEVIHFNDWPEEWSVQRPSESTTESQYGDDEMIGHHSPLKGALARFWHRLRG